MRLRSCLALICVSWFAVVGCAAVSHAPVAVKKAAVSGFDARAFLMRLSEIQGDYGPAGRDPWTVIGSRYLEPDLAAARALISEQLRQFGLTPEHWPYDHGSSDELYLPEAPTTGVNVLAILSATAPSEEWIVVSAHYDTVPMSPGADDNGSGVTAVLLVAEALMRLPQRARNVAFVFFGGEEQGCWGSREFVERFVIAERRRVVSAHNIDMVGWDGDGCGCYSLVRSSEEYVLLGPNKKLPNPLQPYEVQLAAYQREAAKLSVAGRLAGSKNCVDRYVSENSDHFMFVGVVPVATTLAQGSRDEMLNPAYHMPQDTFDRINFAYLEGAARLVTAVVASEL